MTQALSSQGANVLFAGSAVPYLPVGPLARPGAEVGARPAELGEKGVDAGAGWIAAAPPPGPPRAFVARSLLIPSPRPRIFIPGPAQGDIDLFPTTQPDSVPFLLVRPVVEMKGDVVDDDGETAEVPVSKSVPPHAPPAAIVTSEHELPSVIVDLCALEASSEVETVELQRASEVDGLLTTSQAMQAPPMPPVEPLEVAIPIEEDHPLDSQGGTHSLKMRSGSRAVRARGFAIAAVAALTAAGGTFAGLRVCHVTGSSLGAAFHVVR